MERSETEIFERNRIAEIKSHLFAHERAMKDEIRKLWQIDKESEEERTVWRELEPLSTYIFGYVSQIATKGYTRQEPQRSIQKSSNTLSF